MSTSTIDASDSLNVIVRHETDDINPLCVSIPMKSLSQTSVDFIKDSIKIADTPLFLHHDCDRDNALFKDIDTLLYDDDGNFKSMPRMQARPASGILVIVDF